MRPSSVGGGRILRCTLSVRLTVCPSVPYLFILEHRSRVYVNLADVWYLLFRLHARAAYRTAISAAQACLVQVLVRSAMNQYSFYSFFEYFSSSFSKRIAIILVLVFVIKIAMAGRD